MKNLILIFVLAITSTSLAAETTAKVRSKKRPTKTSDEPESKQPSRMTNSVDALLGFSAFGTHSGASYLRLLSEDTYAGVSLLTGKGDITAKSDTALLLEYMTANYFEVSLGGRHFFSETFYLQGVLGYSTFSGRYGVKGNEKQNVNGEITVPYKAIVASLGAGIGNLWTWDSGFNLGCTWLGYNAPLSTSVTVSDADTGSSTSQVLALFLKTDVKDQVTKNVKAINSLYLLRLEVGYSF